MLYKTLRLEFGEGSQMAIIVNCSQTFNHTVYLPGICLAARMTATVMLL